MPRFSLAHSLGMLAAAAAAWLLHDTRIVAVAGAASLAVLVAQSFGQWTPSGRFGAANTVTSLRVALTVALSALRELGPRASLLVFVILALDGLDGWIARHAPKTASAFGARLDMEADALLVLVAGLKLAEVGRLGSWIIVPGLLRYLYAAALSLIPALHEAPRSSIGRVLAGLMMASLAVSTWPVEPVHGPLAAVATALLLASFVRSVWQSRPHG